MIIERILQEITAMGRRIEGMDSAISFLTAETKSMCLDIPNFQSCVTGLEQRVMIMEDHLNTRQDRDQELLYLHSKLVDLEDRNRRNNVRFLGFQEQLEGTDIQEFLRKALPKLTNKTFDPPLEFLKSASIRPKTKRLCPPTTTDHCLPRVGAPTPPGGSIAWSIPD
ncbi:hypothetical protein NDU88_006815 [Pleurodeles waltl]|uniref:Uncharacterized protein n=1 Tax=Pleurodeles waltl TaxID=8319 RepID=A0AAV7NRE1_PLEWA|nr:hypothetical protein NDU88_006815 [Pleurodeles waltl]